jgi:single-strand DNA-binding protein
MVIGNLGGDPELRHLPSGQPVVGFSIATDETYTDKHGQKQEHVEWHRVVAFGKLAETCGEYLKKGRQVYVEGRLRTREFEMKNNGGKRQRVEIVASRVQFLGPSWPSNCSTWPSSAGADSTASTCSRWFVLG